MIILYIILAIILTPIVLYYIASVFVGGLFMKSSLSGEVSRLTMEIEQYLQSAQGYLSEIIEKNRGEIERVKEEERKQLLSLRSKAESAYENWRQSAIVWRQWWEDRWEGMRFADHRWSEWQPSSDAPTRIRLGTLSLRYEIESIGLRIEMEPLPAMLAFRGAPGLLIEAPTSQRNAALLGIQSILFRFLATIPPGKLRFLFIDPIGLGANVASLMNLREFDESEEDSLVTSRAWVEEEHIQRQLGRIKDHISTVIQERLRDQYPDIEEYNRNAGEIAEPYRIVVVFDFPAGFNERAAQALLSIAETGPRCGVFPIVLMNPERKLPYGFELSKLKKAMTMVKWVEAEGRWVWEEVPWTALKFDRPPEPDLAQRLIQEWGQKSIEARKVEVPFARLLTMPGVNLEPERWWKGSTRSELAIPLGPVSPRKPQMLLLGKGTFNHALIVGRTGSGKSNLMHVIITGAALKYPPEELELYLIDLKTVEFIIYRELPHARAVAVDSDREFALSVLVGLDNEMKSRMERFKMVDANDLAEYRDKSGSALPRVLLLIDEFQVLFELDDEIAAEARRLLDRLVRQGRAFGIHVMLGSQSLAGTALPRSTLDQMAVRIALQCSEADSRLVLAEDNPAARRLSRPGQAIYNSANGMVEGNQEFQVALFDDAARDEFLKQIQALTQNHGITRRPLVFEGNAPARLDLCLPLRQRLQNQKSFPKIPEAWIGEPVTMGDPVTVRFPRVSGRHLAVITREEKDGVGVLLATIVGLAASYPADRACFYIGDFTTADAEWADFPEEVARALPHRVEVMGRRDLLKTLEELYRRVRHFVETGETPPDDVYLVILGLQRVRDLRMRGDMGFGPSWDLEEQGPSPVKQLEEILREGPEAGVHVLIWCDTIANLQRALDHRFIEEIGIRVAGAMRDQDSMTWLDTPAAARLDKPYRMLFHDEDLPGVVIKFRPYGIEEVRDRKGELLWRFPDWIREVGKMLRAMA